MYIDTVPSIPASFSHLLTTYANIPPSSQQAHIKRIRDLAYAEHKYPCLGRFRFLDLDMSAHPMYAHIVALFQDAPGSPDMPKFLDLGCCLGQDLRKLIFDISCEPSHDALEKFISIGGASIVPHLFASDIIPQFIELSYGLFNDESIIPRSQFLSPVDIFDSSSTNPLRKLDGRVNVLHVGAVFHLFNLEQQRDVGRGCLRLLSPEGHYVSTSTAATGDDNTWEGGDKAVNWSKTALIFGEQVANVQPTETERQSGGMRFRHNEESWRRMWEELVGEEKWRGVVTGIRAVSRMEKRSWTSKQRDGAGGEEERKKFIGRVEEGFRWQVWWVWIDFA